jgi:SPP1 family predicted phage head-tail adaptor
VFNDGIAMICRKIHEEKPRKATTEKPIIEFYKNVFYGEVSFTANEYYFAKQEGSQIIKRIRIHEDKTIISNVHLIIINGVQYEVGRTYTTDVKGVAVTDITLEKVVTNYDTSRLA